MQHRKFVGEAGLELNADNIGAALTRYLGQHARARAGFHDCLALLDLGTAGNLLGHRLG